jgi:adenylate cyclase
MFETLLGKNFLFKLFVGKYHNPFEESRVFMFLDIKSSTTLAEKLGHKVYLQLLNDFFYDVSIAVSETKGEIYKYVGDEAIISWKMKKVTGKSLPLDCFFRIDAEIEKNRSKYLRKYNIVPEFKAGIHGGTVVTGEMGHMKKEIAFLGDVLNTTARIESLCNTLNQNLLVSDQLLEKLSTEKYKTEQLGEKEMRGKSKAVKISAVHLP